MAPVIALTCRDRLSEHAPTVAKSKEASCPSTAARTQSVLAAHCLGLGSGSLCITNSTDSYEATYSSITRMLSHLKRASMSLNQQMPVMPP
jgi:hypothetical protein